MPLSCEGNGVNVVSCPADERVSSSILSPYICCETDWKAIFIWVNTFRQLHLDGKKHFWDYIFSKIFARWNKTQITQKSKKTGIFYNENGLRVYCHYLCYPACHFLVLQVAIISQILAFLHFSQCKLACISFSLLYLIFFSLLIGFFLF